MILSDVRYISKKFKMFLPILAIVMKLGSLDSSGDDVEYYGFYIFALQFLVLEIFNF